ncbi:MAG: hypothetical protein FWD64_07510, partial [Acidobacteriaceae bacterium]|nr:hypothetical protein [Acidobacteriaceae bacterium]
QQGAAWLGMLKQHRPEPPEDLLARILSKTSQASPTPAASPVFVFRPGGLRAFVHIFMQPRLVMTAAMAFFSIALTLNLTGVRVSTLRDLRPASIQRAIYATGARVAAGLRQRGALQAERFESQLRTSETVRSLARAGHQQ